MKVQPYQIEGEAMPRHVTKSVARIEGIDQATARRYKSRPASNDYPFGNGAPGPLERCDRHLEALQAVNPLGAAIALRYLNERFEERQMRVSGIAVIDAKKKLTKNTLEMLEGLISSTSQEQQEILMLRTAAAITLALGATKFPKRKS